MPKTQQTQIYAAEEELHVGRWFLTHANAQRWVDDLRDTWWWPRLYWRVARVEVGSAARRNKSVGWYDHEHEAGRIELPKLMLNEQTVIHELAHVVTEAAKTSTAHDPVFAREYVRLTYLVRGSKAWLELQAAFERHGVDYTPDVDS